MGKSNFIKKSVMVLLGTSMMISASAFAKVSDFNKMINENMKAQRELHQTLNENIQETREIVQKDNGQAKEMIAQSSDEPNTYVAPSDKNLLRFKKETARYLPSEKKQTERLANELKESF